MAPGPLIDVWLPVVPPRATAQQKRLRVGLGGQVRFFHGPALLREAETWALYLGRHRPAVPILGPIDLAIRFVSPWPKSAPKSLRFRSDLLPKTTKPDVDNMAKHLVDLLVRLAFFPSDAAVARLELSKWWGPDADVGIGIRIGVLADTGDLQDSMALAEKA